MRKTLPRLILKNEANVLSRMSAKDACAPPVMASPARPCEGLQQTISKACRCCKRTAPILFIVGQSLSVGSAFIFEWKAKLRSPLDLSDQSQQTESFSASKDGWLKLAHLLLVATRPPAWMSRDRADWYSRDQVDGYRNARASLSSI